MIATTDSELLSFCGSVVEYYGGLVEPCADHVTMVLPADLAQEFGLPEETTIGPEAPVLYGSPVFDKLVRLATKNVPIVYGRLEIPYLKREGFQDVLERDLHMVSGRMNISGLAEGVSSYITLICHYFAVSDERREGGLVAVSSSESSGCVIDGFEEFRKRFSMSQFQETDIPQEFITLRDLMLEGTVEWSRVLVKNQLQGFFSAVQRRLEREVTRTCNYYSAMEKEMLVRRLNSSQSNEAERKSKMDALPGEMLAKVEEIRHRYSVRVAIEVRGAIRLLVPVVHVLLQIRYRGLTRSFVVIWNPVTRRLDPVPCEICGGAAEPIYTVASGSQLRLVCMSCSGDKNSH